MSHYVSVKTRITEKEFLIKALKRMGCAKVEEGEKLTVKRSYNQTAEVEVKIDEHFGFQREADGSFSAVGDPYYCRGTMQKYYQKDKQLAADLNTSYAIEQTTGRLEEMNFFIDQNPEAAVGNDGLIRMSAVRYVG